MNEFTLTKQLQINPTIRRTIIPVSHNGLKDKSDPAVITVDTPAVMFGYSNTIQHKHVSSHATHPLVGFNMPQILKTNYTRVSPTAYRISLRPANLLHRLRGEGKIYETHKENMERKNK